MGRAVGVRELLVPEVDVVSAEVPRAEGRVVRDGKAGGAAPGQGGVEGWTDGQDAGVDVVGELVAADVGLVEPDLDVILDGVVVGEAGGVGPVARGQVGLAEQVEGRGAGDVELLDVLASGDEDVVGDRVVGEGRDGALDRGEVGAGVVEAHEDGAIRAALEGIGRLALALGKGGRWVGRGGVGVCQDGAGKAGEAQGQKRGGQGLCLWGW